jgi:ABC-type phosphate/phosphonate transport system substrate-binding protein
VRRALAVLFTAVVPIAVALVPPPRSDAAEPAPAGAVLKIGMPENLFSGLPAAVVQTASKPFQAMFEKQTGLKGEVVVVKDYAALAEQLAAEKLDVAVFNGFEFAWVRQNGDLVPLVVAVPQTAAQACVVVHTDSKARTVADLKGNCLAVPNGTKAHCHLFVARCKEKLPDGALGTAKVETGNTLEDALDAVSNKTCAAALVDLGALRGYQKNKPGVGEQLKVLAESEVLPAGVVVYRKGAFDAPTAAKVKDGLIKSTDKPQGQLLAGFWRLKGFSAVGPEYLTALDNSAKAYPAPKK